MSVVDENKRKHLEMIQGVINRLAHCSFLLKGWSVVLVSALFALAAKESKPVFTYLAFLPALVFWGLDGFYLRQERLFRKLYDKVRQAKSDEGADFSMNTQPVKNEVSCWLCVCFSITLIAFHGILVVTVILAAMYIK